MSMFKRFFLLLPLSCLAAGAALAAARSHGRRLKLNPQKSTLVDEMKVASVAANKFSFDFGAGSPESIVADGTDQPGIVGTTFAVTPQGPDQWSVVRKKDGRVLIRAIWTLANDGTLHDDYTQWETTARPLITFTCMTAKGRGQGSQATG